MPRLLPPTLALLLASLTLATTAQAASVPTGYYQINNTSTHPVTVSIDGHFVQTVNAGTKSLVYSTTKGNHEVRMVGSHNKGGQLIVDSPRGINSINSKAPTVINFNG